MLTRTVQENKPKILTVYYRKCATFQEHFKTEGSEKRCIMWPAGPVPVLPIFWREALETRLGGCDDYSNSCHNDQIGFTFDTKHGLAINLIFLLVHFSIPKTSRFASPFACPICQHNWRSCLWPSLGNKKSSLPYRKSDQHAIPFTEWRAQSPSPYILSPCLLYTRSWGGLVWSLVACRTGVLRRTEAKARWAWSEGKSALPLACSAGWKFRDCTV